MPFCLLTIGEGKVTVCSWKTASFSFRETTVAWAFWLGGKMGLLANKQKKRENVFANYLQELFLYHHWEKMLASTGPHV